MTNDGSPRQPQSGPDWELLARYSAGECAPDEEAAVRTWLDTNPTDAAAIAALERASKRLALVPPPDLDVEAALRRVSARIREPELRAVRGAPARPRPARWVGIAGLAAAAGIGAIVVVRANTRGSGNPGDAVPTISGPRGYATLVGGRDSVVLSDGSRVVLGPESQLNVPADYGVTTRAVQLRGVAYFDVVHDPAKPFSVRDAGALVTDLGTRFSVQDDADGTVHVAVTAGSVSLRAASASTARGVTLAVGDRALIDAAGRTQTFPGTAKSEDLAWMHGQLVFRDAPLTHVAAELRRWYGIELRADSALATQHVDHVAAPGESGRHVVDVIAITLGARVDQRGDTVFLRAASPRAAPQ